MKKITQLLAALAISALVIPALHAQHTPPVSNPMTIVNGMSSGQGTGGKNLTTVGTVWGTKGTFDWLTLVNLHTGDKPDSIYINSTGKVGAGMSVTNVQILGGLWFESNESFVIDGPTAYLLTGSIVQMSAGVDLTIDVGNLTNMTQPEFRNLNKTGDGRVIFGSKVNSQANWVNVYEGELKVDGRLNPWRAYATACWGVTVAAGATLSGTGTIDIGAYSTDAGFTVAGTLIGEGLKVNTMDGSVPVDIVMETGSTLQIDFELGNAALFLGTNIGLDLTKGGVKLVLTNFVADELEGKLLISGDVDGWFSSIETDYGTFTGGASSGIYTYGDYAIALSKDGGKLYMDVELIPEPTTWALMLGGLGALAFLRRRRA